jgi:hypothetical protein
LHRSEHRVAGVLWRYLGRTSRFCACGSMWASPTRCPHYASAAGAFAALPLRMEART